jgi:DNA-binding response OmpR family regulator
MSSQIIGCCSSILKPPRNRNQVVSVRNHTDYHFQLEGLGANHSFEPSNRQALEYLASHQVDAAIVDFHLRDGCCIPILRYLTARHIPFIVISGDTFAMREIAIDAPVLSKPVLPSDVCQALCNAFP